MNTQKKLLNFTLISSIAAILLIIFFYNKRYQQKQQELLTHQKSLISLVNKITSKGFTLDSIVHLIKLDPDYLGDSISISAEGSITSNNEAMNGTIREVQTNNENLIAIFQKTQENNLPLPYNVYKLAAQYYKMQSGTDPRKK